MSSRTAGCRAGQPLGSALGALLGTAQRLLGLSPCVGQKSPSRINRYFRALWRCSKG